MLFVFMYVLFSVAKKKKIYSTWKVSDLIVNVSVSLFKLYVHLWGWVISGFLPSLSFFRTLIIEKLQVELFRFGLLR